MCASCSYFDCIHHRRLLIYGCFLVCVVQLLLVQAITIGRYNAKVALLAAAPEAVSRVHTVLIVIVRVHMSYARTYDSVNYTILAQGSLALTHHHVTSAAASDTLPLFA
jgi:hypothetical protein